MNERCDDAKNNHAIGKEVFYSKGLILISDIPDILHETWDADIVDMLIEYYF